MKTVLFISYSFPPDNWSGSYPPYYFARYLPEFGWKPLVVCRDWSRVGLKEANYDLLDSLPKEVEIYAIEAPGDGIIGRRASPHNRMLFWMNPSGWCRNVIKALPQIVGKKSIDVIFASFPPDASLYIGSYAARRWGKPWVADFRDVRGEHDADTNRLSFWFRAAVERAICRSSKVFTTVTPPLIDMLCRYHNKKTFAIYNGYCEEEYASLISSTSEQLTIRCTGFVHPRLNRYDLFFDGLEKALASEAVSPDELRVEMYGVLDQPGYEIIRSAAKQRNLDDVVFFFERVAHAKVVWLQKTADVLLFFPYPCGGELPSKLPEYLGARRPVLSVPMASGVAGQALLTSRAGVGCNSAGEIARQISLWHKEWKRNGKVHYDGVESEIRKFSYRYQTGKLASILNRVAGTG